jgi:hypothetical protein
MDRLRVGDGEQFDVVDETARLEVDPQGPQAQATRHVERLVAGVALEPPLPLLLRDGGLDGGGHPGETAADDRGRPAAAGQRRLPADVLGLAPRDGQVVGRLGVALARGPAPLRPRVGGGRDRGDERTERDERTAEGRAAG